MPKATQVGKAAINLEMDIDSLIYVLLGFSEHHTEENGKESWGQNAALFNPISDGKEVWKGITVLNLTLLALMQLADDQLRRTS